MAVGAPAPNCSLVITSAYPAPPRHSERGRWSRRSTLAEPEQACSAAVCRRHSNRGGEIRGRVARAASLGAARSDRSATRDADRDPRARTAINRLRPRRPAAITEHVAPHAGPVAQVLREGHLGPGSTMRRRHFHTRRSGSDLGLCQRRDRQVLLERDLTDPIHRCRVPHTPDHASHKKRKSLADAAQPQQPLDQTGSPAVSSAGSSTASRPP